MFGIEISKSDLPDEKNPAIIDPTSPEITDRYKGVDFGATTCDGLVLSPVLFSYFLQFADPLFNEKEFIEERNREVLAPTTTATDEATEVGSNESTSSLSSAQSSVSAPQEQKEQNKPSFEFNEGAFLNQLQKLKEETEQRLDDTNKKLEDLKS